MAGIGLYGVYYAKCKVANNIVTGYTGGTKSMGKAISATFTPTETENNPLYANNAVAESDAASGSGGTLNMTLDRLTMAAAADLYGLTEKEVSVTMGDSSATGKGFDYTGDEISAPVGAAYIRQMQEDNDRGIHEVVLYRRATFSMPSEEAQTLGETVEWQTPEITGTVVGKESGGSAPWRQRYRFDTQDAAIAWIESVFGEPADEG